MSAVAPTNFNAEEADNLEDVRPETSVIHYSKADMICRLKSSLLSKARFSFSVYSAILISISSSRTAYVDVLGDSGESPGLCFETH